LFVIASDGSLPPLLLGKETGAWKSGASGTVELTVTVTEPVLSAELGSVEVVVAVAELVKVPSAVAVTTMVIVAVVPAFMVPSEQVTVLVPEQLPCDDVSDWNVCPAGRGSVTVTFDANEGPLLATVMVYVSVPFWATGLGVASFVTERFAVPGVKS
jgi:hypothetical protein